MSLYKEIVELAKRRGFFWPSYEIYGGVGGLYDLGPLGALLKQRIMEKWRKWFIQKHQHMVVEIETPVIMPSKVLEASGHVESFTDPIVECTNCHRMFRADHVVEDAVGIKTEGLTPEQLTRIIREKNIRCPACGGELGEVRVFNLLFQTQIGPYKGNVGYLRPEAAQGMFVAFKRVYESMRGRLPLGIGQIGRVARNEISPRQGMIRLREFTIMEVEFFFDPEEDYNHMIQGMEGERLRILSAKDRMEGREEPREYTLREALEQGVIIHPLLGYWMVIARKFVEELGVPYENQFFEEKLPEERAHYASQTFDQLVKVERWGWVEVSGHAYRGDYDLSRHMKFSGQDLTVFKPYPEPRTVRRKRIVANKQAIGRTFKSKAPRILEELSRMEPGRVEEALGENGYIEVAGERLTREHVHVEVVEEKVAGKRFIPHVVEPSFGAERLVYVALEYAYRKREGRTVLSLPRDIAPFQVAVFPLVSNVEGIVREARRLRDLLVDAGFYVFYDESGAIGRRYARADEVGIPVSVTVDHQTLEDGTVTLRDRDTWRQVRLPATRVVEAVERFVWGGAELEELGEPVEG